MDQFETVHDLLSKLNMLHHFDKFKEEGYDDTCLLNVIDSDLKELGLSLGERKKFVSSTKNFYSKKVIEDQLQLIEEQLETFYSHEDFINFHRIDSTRLSLDTCYVNLTVIPMDKHNPLDKRGFKASESDFSMISEQLLERSNENPELIQLEHLFSRTKTDLNWEHVNQKRILIFGKAGVGKTTLCKKIVYDYYKKNVWKNNFHRVIWLALRDLKQMTKPGDKVHAELSDVYTHRFLNKFEDGIVLSDVITEEERNEKKILFILDGWDEIGELLADGHFMKKVLLDQLLKKPFLIVTSRPYTMGLESSQFNEVLETIGFTKENIFQYIKTVLPSDNYNQNKVLNFVNSHSTISGMASIPIQLDMICYLCGNIEDLEKCLSTETATMTKLYDVLVKKMMDLNQIRKSGSLTFEWISDTYKNIFSSQNSGNCSQLKFMAEVAYNAFLQNQIEFSDKFFPIASTSYSLEIRNEVKESFFLNCLNPSDAAEKKSYTYIHLTIQEYLAALYIVHILEKDKLPGLVSKYKYNPRFKIIWSFVAGLIDDPNDLDMYFNYLERSPVEITGIPHQLLMIICINECESILNPKRMDRLLEELWNWLPTGIPLETLQLPNKLYDKMLTWTFDLEETNLMKSETYLLCCRFLPESIVLRLLDRLPVIAIVADEEESSVVKKAQHIVRYKHGFVGLKTIEKIEFHLKDIINFLTIEASESKRQKALSWSHLLINLLKNCDLNDSIYSCLFNLFDAMVYEPDGAEGRATMIIISKVVGNSRSKYKDELMHKLTDLLIHHSLPKFRMALIDCFWDGKIKEIPGGMQIILAEFLESIPYTILKGYLQSLKVLHPCMIEKLLEYVESHPDCQLRYDSLQILSSQKNLPEEILSRILDVFQSTDDKSLRLRIYHVFMCQDKISDLTAEKLLAPLDQEDVLKDEVFLVFLPISENVYGSVLHEGYLNNKVTTVPAQVIEKLGQVFNTYYLQGKTDIAIKILACLKRFRQIPENMRANLYSYFKSRNHTISEMKIILETVKYQCVLCDTAEFIPILINIGLNNKEVLADIKQIFKHHQHLFETEKIDKFLSRCNDDDIKFTMIDILTQCENVPTELLFKAITFLMETNTSEIDDNAAFFLYHKNVKTLGNLLASQALLPDSVLTYIFDRDNWTQDNKYALEVPRLINFLPLSKILNNLDENNWEQIFDHVILNRLRKMIFPIPVIQMVEDKNKLAIVIPAENEPQEINHLKLSYVVNKVRQEKYLPHRPDPFTLHLKFHSKPESLLHIQKLPMKLEIENMELRGYTNRVRKYIKFQLFKENPSKEDFDILFKEIGVQLETGNFLHLDLRDNQLNDENISGSGNEMPDLNKGKKVQNLKECLRNSQKQISTLILSNNQITCGKNGLRSLLDTSFCTKIGLKYLYLDRNNIYLNQSDFDATLRNANSLLAQSGLEILDLSGNFIPEGKLGPYFDNILAPQHILRSSGLSEPELQRNVSFIKSSSILNSCEVADESFSFTPIHNQFYCLRTELEYQRKVSKSVGCITLAYAKTNILSKHAFFGIDWVPPDQCDNFGQRQLIRSELVTDQNDKSHIRIKILQIPPTKFVSDFSAKNVKIRGVIFTETEKISQFLHAIYRSRDTANIYEYKLLASSSNSQQGQFNCITWADIMLKQFGITIDTMKTSFPLSMN